MEWRRIESWERYSSSEYCDCGRIGVVCVDMYHISVKDSSKNRLTDNAKRLNDGSWPANI